MRIEAQVGMVIVRHLAHQTGKRQLAEQEIGGFLVLPARSSTFQYEGARGIKCSTRLIYGPWTKTMWLFHSTTCGGTLTRRPSNWNLLRRATAGGFVGSLLRPAAARFSALQPKALVAVDSPGHLPCVLPRCLAALFMHSGLRCDDDRYRWMVTDAAAETVAVDETAAVEETAAFEETAAAAEIAARAAEENIYSENRGVCVY
jgi:hypothetical protein